LIDKFDNKILGIEYYELFYHKIQYSMGRY
jgi:hypothetical protein